MSTPLGHGLVGYLLARAAGVQSPLGRAAAVGVANLPDIDFLQGFVTNGDPFSLHHETITHRPVFPLLVGATTALLAFAAARLRGGAPTLGDVVKPAALATALVGSHVAADPLPLPYRIMWPYEGTFWQVVAANVWNVVIDLAVYGGLARLVLGRQSPKEQVIEA